MTLQFPPTAHQWLRLAQIAFCGAAALSTVALGQPRRKAPGLRLVTPAVTFFFAACITRFLLEETQSRLQMAAFAAAALLLERLRSRAAGEPFAWWRWALNTGAAVAGVLLAKHVVEPGSISAFFQGVVESSRAELGV